MNVWPVVVDAVTHVLPLLLDTSYLVIALPPLLAGADQLRATCPFPGVALKFCGTEGVSISVVKVIASLCPDPVPPFLAIARAIYAVLGSRPVIVVLNELVVTFTGTSRNVVSVDLRIQNPRAVMAAPPVLVIFPVSTTVVAVVVPLETVSVGNAATGVAVTLI